MKIKHKEGTHTGFIIGEPYVNLDMVPVIRVKWHDRQNEYSIHTVQFIVDNYTEVEDDEGGETGTETDD